MTEATTGRLSRYILDGDDQDLRRLLAFSEVTSAPARRAFARAGLSDGWAAIDCGCGPIGALADMADMVGPRGRVVGVDVSAAAIERAAPVAAKLGLDNVELVTGDIHSLDPATLGAPFDLAFTRLFLMHQADPARTLSKIAQLVRPGGWIIAHEPLRSPPPRSHPHLDALDAYYGLLHEMLERIGVPPGVVEGLPRSARAAGLEVVSTEGFFVLGEPELAFEIHASTLEAFKDAAVSLGVQAGHVDALIGALRGGQASGYEWVSTPFFMDLALRTPAG
jgi:SAM-dependent methyltransferase